MAFLDDFMKLPDLDRYFFMIYTGALANGIYNTKFKLKNGMTMQFRKEEDEEYDIEDRELIYEYIAQCSKEGGELIYLYRDKNIGYCVRPIVFPGNHQFCISPEKPFRYEAEYNSKVMPLPI